MRRRFDWDPAKAELNLEKHQIAFVLAADVFDDPNVLYELDDRFDYGEVRQQATGRVGTMMIAVIFTERGAMTRLISARKANKGERERYGHPRN